MELSRVLAGCVTVLLLSVSSFAAACDLSCGLALLQSDCHSAQMSAEDSMPGAMTMDGMAMPGMTDVDSGSPQIVSAQPHSESHHAVVGEMGPCERQSCDQVQVLAAKANHSATAQFDVIGAVVGFPSLVSSSDAFDDAQDDLAPPGLAVCGPFDISLRI